MKINRAIGCSIVPTIIFLITGLSTISLAQEANSGFARLSANDLTSVLIGEQVGPENAFILGLERPESSVLSAPASQPAPSIETLDSAQRITLDEETDLSNATRLFFIAMGSDIKTFGVENMVALAAHGYGIPDKAANSLIRFIQDVNSEHSSQIDELRAQSCRDFRSSVNDGDLTNAKENMQAGDNSIHEFNNSYFQEVLLQIERAFGPQLGDQLRQGIEDVRAATINYHVDKEAYFEERGIDAVLHYDGICERFLSNN